jgi:hypothetical protein
MAEEGKIIIASDAGIAIQSFADISDAISATFGARGLMLTEADLTPEFFNLRTGLAGELLQKFTNYQLRVAIVLPDAQAYGERFSELAYEHSTHNLIRFVRTIEEAQAWFGS